MRAFGSCCTICTVTRANGYTHKHMHIDILFSMCTRIMSEFDLQLFTQCPKSADFGFSPVAITCKQVYSGWFHAIIYNGIDWKNFPPGRN